MERSNKKRVSHVECKNVLKNCNVVNNVVTDIMKKMDTKIADSGNQEFHKILKSREKGSRRSNIGISSGISNQPNISKTLPKRGLHNKRHFLMEKVRKNINYIKHNRSMPKPRAHLSGLCDLDQGKKYQIPSSSNTTSSNLKKTNVVSAISKQTKRNRPIYNNFSDESVSDVNKFPVSSSDSEFESFIRAQKQDPDLCKKNFSKCTNRNKHKKHMNANERKTSLQRRKCSKVEKLKSVILKSDNEESLQSDDNQTSRKHPYYEMYDKLTTNRLLLSDSSVASGDSSVASGDSSVASGDESDLNDRLYKADEGSSSPSIERENYGKIEPDNFMCAVRRTERNQSLEEMVTLMNPPLQNGNQNNEFRSKLQGKENNVLNEWKEENVLDSDGDDCTIVYEVSKSNNSCVAERGDFDSDIQILSVVSLGECQGATDTNNGVSKNQSFHFDGN